MLKSFPLHNVPRSMNLEPTNQDILDVLQSFAGSVDDRFVELKDDISDIKADVAVLKTDVAVLKTDVAVLKTDVSALKTDMVGVKATMVTKEYLDDKMFDLRGDLVSLVRKEDRKLVAVVDELVKRDVFDHATAHRIFELEPFAK